MASISTEHLIWFIISVFVAGTASLALVPVMNQMADNIEDSARGHSGQLGSAMIIINDPAVVPYDVSNGTLEIYAKNTGRTHISKMGVLALINGTSYLVSDSDIEVMGVLDLWGPGQVARVNISVPGLDPGHDYRIHLHVNTVDRGGRDAGHASAEMWFRIGTG